MSDLAIDWVEIPAGTVQRGTSIEEIDSVFERYKAYGIPRSYFAKEAPRTEIRVATFAISRVPVTVAQWRAFCAVTGWSPPDGDGRLPIEPIAWWEAQAYCEWASRVTGFVVRLPTEDEWERAARGDDDREFPWGDTYENRRANQLELGLGHALPVGSLPLGASPFGVLDLAGNVDEWTSTEYYAYPGAPDEVPETEEQAFDRHITRGGSWFHCMDLARCARRHGMYEPGGSAGFRVAADV